jgi:hypothetical protein
MSIDWSTPWHKASFDRFIQDRLPQLLAERLPLAGYTVQPNGRTTCQINVSLASPAGDVTVAYSDIPQPDDDGLFEIDGELKVVIPTASGEELDVAEIRCVGEQLYESIQQRLGYAPPDLPWDAELARAWLPLDTWIGTFMRQTAQRLDTTNWLSHRTHLRRIIVLNHKNVVAPGQAGRVCPFEMPEGANLGRVFTIALGAKISGSRLVVVDERPAANLGLSASMIPFLEHDDPNRLLMGANMLRQSLPSPSPEPALVQTGNEPDAPDFWCGRNLLTAFVSWGADTYADGIVISQSCASRLDYPYPVEVGDKLANRHGTKGVVSRILPDAEMPHLPDGTPVELVFNFSGLHVRLNFGQSREALLGRIARAEGQPAIVPPFDAPDQAELRARLVRAGLPPSGMETLTMGQNGPRLERPSAVGRVYWLRLAHLARNKAKVTVTGEGGLPQGEAECRALRDLGAYENLHETLNTRSARRADAAGLASRLEGGPLEQAGAPSPMAADLANRLRLAGIHMTLAKGRLTFGFAPSPAHQVDQASALKLARPVPHPWLREHELAEIGPLHGAGLPQDEYRLLVETNERLARMVSSQTPERLVRDVAAQLAGRVEAFCNALLTPAHLRFGEQQLFSGSAVIAPGADLGLDQVGLADEIAWALFGPLASRELGDAAEVKARSERAAQALDAVMARAWVIVHHAPTFVPTALLALHPRREPGHVIRLHPLACQLLDADFDGDEVAIFLPLTTAAQREAGERLSIAGHLARDARLLETLLPPEVLWGLASLSLAQDGRREIARLAGIEVAAPKGVPTQATLAEALRQVLERDGVDAVLAAVEHLMRRGFEVAKASGASMSPFIGEGLVRPPLPEADDAEVWDAYTEEMAEQILSGADYAGADLGPQLLGVSVRARGRRHLPRLVAPRGAVANLQGQTVIVRHSQVEGLTPAELYACAVGARQGLAQLVARWEELDRGTPAGESGWFTVLARARPAKRPGVVFARAAAIGEVDPLADVDSRLLVGLPIGIIAE